MHNIKYFIYLCVIVYTKVCNKVNDKSWIMQGIIKEISDVGVRSYYDGLGRKERGRFIMWLTLKLGWSSVNTTLSRINNGGWSVLERPVVSEVISSECWRNSL